MEMSEVLRSGVWAYWETIELRCMSGLNQIGDNVDKDNEK